MRRLLIRPGAIGDFVVSLPALECLRADYLEVWAAAQNLPLVRFAGRVRSITASGLDLLELPDMTPPAPLVDELRSFDSIVSWYGAGREEFRHATRKLGLPFHFFPALPLQPWMHAVDFYLAQAGTLCECHVEAVPRIPCSGPREDFAVIHPFAGSRQKCWPLERYRDLARRLRIPVRWCAGPEDDLPGAVRIANLYELACWLARARVYIGNDSGISHLAAAAGTPVVALFGPTDPAVWAPRGPVVKVLAPMERIAVEDVLAVL